MSSTSILRAGWATKRGQIKKSWKRRYFVLRSDFNLCYYKSGATQNKPKGCITLSKETTLHQSTTSLQDSHWPPSSNPGARFSIAAPSRTYYMFCDSAEAATAWVNVLRELIFTGTVTSSSSADSAVASVDIDDSAASMQVLQTLSKLPENRACADCGVTGPSWASWNIGIFICLKCAGVHRGLGTQISKVRSVNLDQWSAFQVQSLQSKGNEHNRKIYEARLPEFFKRPRDGGELDAFIRSKYVDRKYCEPDTASAASNTFDPFAAPARQASTNPFEDMTVAVAEFNPFLDSSAPTSPTSPAGASASTASSGKATRRVSMAPETETGISSGAPSKSKDASLKRKGKLDRYKSSTSIGDSSSDSEDEFVDPMDDHSWF